MKDTLFKTGHRSRTPAPRFPHAHAGVVACVLVALCTSGIAQARTSFTDALGSGTPLIDIRARHEGVSDANCGACAGRDAAAETLRARLGYETGSWNGLSVLFAFDKVVSPGPEDYNSKVNGHTRYPVVADPTMTAMDRLALTYRSDFDTTVTVGRQAIVLGNARFLGNVGFRQHEQTFDALKLTNTSLPDTVLTYVWIDRVNRVFGPDAANSGAAAGHFNSNSHVLDALYNGIGRLKLEAYAYLLDLKQAPTASTATYGLRATWSTQLTQRLGVQLTGAFAHQTGYARNPDNVSLNYWKLAGQLHYAGLGAGVGDEAMQGNGTVGFATPLATLHAFDGWADLFLSTPKDGIDDRYATLSYTLPHADDAVTLAPQVTYHRFATDRTGTGIGNEWDLALNAAFGKHVALNLSHAHYNGAGLDAGGFRDKSITWLTASYRY